MKKYEFEASRKQLEKPTEPKYLFNTTAKTIVYAEDECEAEILAKDKLEQEYYGTGVVLGEPLMVRCSELPIDWSYGYGDARRSGPTDSIGDLVGNHVIR